jgi:hypothetical protein
VRVIKAVVGVAAAVVLFAGTGSYFLFFRGPSKEEYIAQADPICKGSNDALKDLAAPVDLAQLKDATAKLATTSKTLGTDLRKLEQPRGDDTKRAADVTKAIEDAGAKAQALSDAAAREDLPAAEKVVPEIGVAFKLADEKARAFGMVQCGPAGASAAQTISSAAAGVFKKSFTSRADALCGKAKDEIDKVPEPDTQAQAVAQVDSFRAIADRVINEIRALPVAAADKPPVDEFLAELEKNRDKIAEVRDATRAGNLNRLDALFEELIKLAESAGRKADAAGIPGCRRFVES